jgi:hypothetical protein
VKSAETLPQWVNDEQGGTRIARAAETAAMGFSMPTQGRGHGAPAQLQEVDHRGYGNAC